jgi:hypothetical protein
MPLHEHTLLLSVELTLHAAWHSLLLKPTVAEWHSNTACSGGTNMVSSTPQLVRKAGS